MDEQIKNFVETYQCPGCVCGSDISCFSPSANGIECSSHVPGTALPLIGRVYLGMPKGFNRLGLADTPIRGFKSLEDSWHYDHFNIPVWKHKDEHGNTLVRGLSPRVNMPFLHIFLCDCIAEIDCYEVTDEDIRNMD